MDKNNKDIRRLLMGSFYLDEKNRIAPSSSVLRSMFSGYQRGADVLRLFGIKERHFSCTSRGSARGAAERAMLSIGEQCILPDSPETFAVMRRGVLLFPVLMTLETEGERMHLGLYTARSLLSGVNLRRMLQKWQEALPAEHRPTTVTAEPGIGKKEA